MKTSASILPDDPLDEESIFGVVIGIVSKTTGDPMSLNRILVDFPTLQVSSAWARVASFAAGPNRGAFFLPQENDEVLIAFEGGDVSRPYVIGVLWNGVDKPPVAPDMTQTVRRIQSASGAYIQFDDTDGGTSVIVTDKNGNKIVIDTKANSVTVASTGALTVSAPEGKLTLTAASVEINAAKGALTLSTAADASLKAGGEVAVAGSVIRLN